MINSKSAMCALTMFLWAGVYYYCTWQMAINIHSYVFYNLGAMIIAIVCASVLYYKTLKCLEPLINEGVNLAAISFLAKIFAAIFALRGVHVLLTTKADSLVSFFIITLIVFCKCVLIAMAADDDKKPSLSQ